MATEARIRDAHGILGVEQVPLRQAPDRRGSLATIFQQEHSGLDCVQWNLVRSSPGVLRGVHVHADYAEYYVPIAGRQYFVLKDARSGSASHGRTATFWLAGDDSTAIVVPPGVAHGVAFPQGGTLLYGLSAAWTGDGEFGCRWDDPDLGIAWPIDVPVLSDRDAGAAGYRVMADDLNRALGAAQALG